MFAKCPVCKIRIELGPIPREGEIITCPNCGTDLEVRFGSNWELVVLHEPFEGSDRFEPPEEEETPD